MWRNTGTTGITLTVGNIDCMDTSHIKHCEGNVGGWYPAVASVVMAKAEDSTEVFERHT